MNKNISVIVPVYNVEHYLHQCIDSIIHQTFRDLEIILVNDGSTDGSAQICDEFAEKDHRIEVIHQQNAGVSSARNAGLEIAHGKYVGFVDADDTIEKDFFDTLFLAAEINQCDLVFSKLAADENYLVNNTKYTRNEIADKILPVYLGKDIFNSIWNKLYLNELVKRHNVIFPLDKKLGEDAAFNLEFLEFCDALYYLDYVGYHYREVLGSATRNVCTQNYLEDAITLFSEEPSDFIKNNITQEDILRLKSTRLIHYIMSLVYIYSEPGNGISLVQKIKKLNNLVNNNIVAQVFSDNTNAQNYGRYQHQIYNFIKSKGVFPLYFLSLYSYYRNS